MISPWAQLRTLDDAWIGLLHQLGARLHRTDECFVAWLGDEHTLSVAHDQDLDDDDTLAQIILHELCHHWVEGPQSWNQDDWGLNNQTDDDLAREYAALRLQAAVLSTTNLRTYLQPTTDHRWFYEALDRSPLEDPVDAATDAHSIAAAHHGWKRWQEWPQRADLHALLAVSDTLLSSFARAR